MMHLDLSATLNLISTLAIVGALIFTGLQVRAANLARREQAAITLIQTSQSESWTRALDLIGKLPENAQASDVERVGPELERSIWNMGVRLETIGYMVFRRNVTLETVDDLMGGVTLMFWSRTKNWCEHDRVRTGNPKSFEWCEWLANRISERRQRLGHNPAHLRYARWRE